MFVRASFRYNCEHVAITVDYFGCFFVSDIPLNMLNISISMWKSAFFIWSTRLFVFARLLFCADLHSSQLCPGHPPRDLAWKNQWWFGGWFLIVLATLHVFYTWYVWLYILDKYIYIHIYIYSMIYLIYTWYSWLLENILKVSSVSSQVFCFLGILPHLSN